MANVPADIAYADEYAQRYSISFRVGIDPNRINFYKYFDQNATPYTMVVKRDGMTIRYATMGWDTGGAAMQQNVKSLIEEILAEE